MHPTSPVFTVNRSHYIEYLSSSQMTLKYKGS